MKTSRLIGNLHAKFAEQFTAEAPTAVSVAAWLKNAKLQHAEKWNLDDSVFALRVAGRFKIPDMQKSLAEKIAISDISTRGLSVIASALAAYPGDNLEIARQILETATTSPAQDARSLSRLLKMAATFPSAVTEECAAALTRNFQVLAETGMLGTPDDLRGFLEFFARFKSENVHFIFKLIASDAALQNHDDALACLEISSRMPECPGALHALRALRLACLRCSAEMTQSQRADLACILGRMGSWNLESCGMLERKIFSASKKHTLSISDFSKLLAFTTGAVSRNFHVSSKMVADHLCAVVSGSCDALSAARTLWAIHAADLLSSPPARFSNTWSGEQAEIAAQAETRLVAMLSNLEISTSTENLEYWIRLAELEELGKFKFPGAGVEWARFQVMCKRKEDPVCLRVSEILGETKDASVAWASEEIAVHVDLAKSPVGPAVMLEILKRRYKTVHVVDAVSWFSQSDASATLTKMAKSPESSVMYDASVLVEPPINWNEEEIKIPGNAMRFSLRRANSPYLK